MRHVVTLTRRELSAYFLRPMAYFVLLGFQFIALLDFFQLVELLSDPRYSVSFSGRLDPMVGYVAGSGLFWVALLVAVPALTMRLIAEERRSGTIEGLLTAPVTEGEVVLGKWLAGVVMYLSLLLPFAVYLPFLRWVGDYPVAGGPLMALGVGLTTMGMLLVAIGLLFSAATSNQIVAAVGTFAALLGLLAVYLLPALRLVPAGWGEAIGFVAIYAQLGDFAAGRLDLRVVAVHLSGAAFALYLAVKALEWRRGAAT